MLNSTMYCICLDNKLLPTIKKLDYVPVGLGNAKFSKEWLKDDTLVNISHKNKYYSEYTFDYWFWKNILPKIEDNHWVGFCNYRRFWLNNKIKITENSKVEDVVIREIPTEWENFDTILGNHVYINNLKLSKLIKHGIWSLIRNPSALFKSKRNIRFHFDMWHGNGNLDKAIDLVDDNDREDFRKFTRQNISTRGCLYVCRSKKIMNNYYSSLFPWLERCEKIFGFNLKGYGNIRIYGFLAERYHAYWFNKYTKSLSWPIIFYDISKQVAFNKDRQTYIGY